MKTIWRQDNNGKKINSPIKKNYFLKFFSNNPVVTLIMFIIAVASFILAIYFYNVNKQFRELTYFVHPVKASVVKTGVASNLSVKYSNQEIKTDVSVAQIAFWNKGNLSIRRNNILKPFIIQLKKNTSDARIKQQQFDQIQSELEDKLAKIENRLQNKPTKIKNRINQVQKGLPILEVSLSKITRDVTGISIDKSNLKNGIVSLNWEILEHNDGGVIQLIYAGGTDVEITADGIIEGQTKIKQPQYLLKMKTPDEQYIIEKYTNKFMGYMALILSIISIVLVYRFIGRRFVIRNENNKVDKMELIMNIFLSVNGLLFLAYGIYILLTLQSGVPFNF